MKTQLRVLMTLLVSSLSAGCANLALEEPKICKSGTVTVDAVPAHPAIPGFDPGPYTAEFDVTFDPGDLISFFSVITMKGGEIYLAGSADGGVANLDFIDRMSVVLRGNPDITLLDYTRVEDNVTTIDIPPRSDNLLPNLPSEGATLHFLIAGDLPNHQWQFGWKLCFGGEVKKNVNLLNLSGK